MSLLYECINGIIQGGILEGSAGTIEGDSIARLCVGKLRGMLVVEGDPNRMLVQTSLPPCINMSQSNTLRCLLSLRLLLRIPSL